MPNTNGSQSLTKSMNGLIDITDGGGTEIVDGTITCNSVLTNRIITDNIQGQLFTNSINLYTATSAPIFLGNPAQATTVSSLIINGTQLQTTDTSLDVSIYSNQVGIVIVGSTKQTNLGDYLFFGTAGNTYLGVLRKNEIRYSDLTANVSLYPSQTGSILIGGYGPVILGGVYFVSSISYLGVTNEMRIVNQNSPYGLCKNANNTLTIGNVNNPIILGGFTFNSQTLRSSLPATAVSLFDNQTSIINVGTPTASFRQQGSTAIGLSGSYATTGTCGLEITTSTNTSTLNFHSGANWGTSDTSIQSVGGNGTVGGGTLELTAATTNIITNIFNVANVPITGTGNRIEIATVSGIAYLDFHTSGFVIDYDSRILATGGTATVGTGSLNLYASTINMNGIVGMNNPITLNYLPSAIGTNQLGSIINSTGTTSSMVANTATNIRQITLTAGVWLLQGNMYYSTPGSYYQFSISLASTNIDLICANIGAGVSGAVAQVTRTVSISSSQTWYLMGGAGSNTLVSNIVFTACRIA